MSAGDELMVGERALLVGFVACGEIRRRGEWRYAARDRQWRPLGEFPSEAAARAAIEAANRAADEARARQWAATSASNATIRRRRPPAKKSRPFARLHIRLGAVECFVGPSHFGQIRHVARRRYVALAPSGADVGDFTNLRRAIEALAGKATT